MLNCASFDGYYGVDEGLTACTICPAGYACPAGSASATACGAGWYSAASSRICTPCPAGNACPDTTRPTINPCTLGTYAGEAQASCTICPAGYSCSATTAIACPSGMYAEQGSGYCWYPPAGVAAVAVSGASVTFTQCASGYYKLDGLMDSACTICPAGHRCPDIQQPPEKCPAGTYQGWEGQTYCHNCNAGQFSLYG